MLHFESFSTLRESCYVFGGCWEGVVRSRREAGLNPKKPLENPHPLALTPPPGLPNTKIDFFHHLSIYIKGRDTLLYTKGYDSNQQHHKRRNPHPAWLYCHSANGRCYLSSLLLKSSSWWEGGLCSLRLLAPQILKSALPGGGPKGSECFIIIIFFKTPLQHLV